MGKLNNICHVILKEENLNFKHKFFMSRLY
jgi:hypothetical protein